MNRFVIFTEYGEGEICNERVNARKSGSGNRQEKDKGSRKMGAWSAQVDERCGHVVVCSPLCTASPPMSPITTCSHGKRAHSTVVSVGETRSTTRPRSIGCRCSFSAAAKERLHSRSPGGRILTTLVQSKRHACLHTHNCRYKRGCSGRRKERTLTTTNGVKDQERDRFAYQQQRLPFNNSVAVYYCQEYSE